MDKFKKWLNNFVEGTNEVSNALIGILPALLIIFVFFIFFKGCILGY